MRMNRINQAKIGQIVSRMAKIAYLLLAHKDPSGVIAQAKALAAAGDYVVIHYDRRADMAEARRIGVVVSGTPNVVMTPRRIACGWGTWSLVAATLLAARTALDHFPRATHLYLISGDCLPIKTAEHSHAALDAADQDHIETASFLRSDWIKTGMKEDRLIYRHLFNEREHPKAFYAALWVQRRFVLARQTPADLDIRIGSQWWCLRRRTVERLLAFLKTHPQIARFFRTTWIPDEIFFQTLVRHLVPRDEITGVPPTFLLFTDYGLPVSFYEDQRDFLLRQQGFFARKISPGATALRKDLLQLYAQQGIGFDGAGNGKALHGFLTRRGRIGRRFVPRCWDMTAAPETLPRLTVVLTKSQQVSTRLCQTLATDSTITAFGPVFDTVEFTLPDMGGLEQGLAKRKRHPAAFLRVLAHVSQANHLLICLDPGQLDLATDLCTDWPGLQAINLCSPLDDATLSDLAQRMSLTHCTTSQAERAEVRAALRDDAAYQHQLVQSALACPVFQLGPGPVGLAQTSALAQVLSVSHDVAQRVIRASGLDDET